MQIPILGVRMAPVFQLVGPKQVVQIFGVKLVGVNAENGKKLLFSIAFILLMYLIAKILRGVAHLVTKRSNKAKVVFWTRQVTSVILTVIGLTGLVSIWFDNPTRLAQAAALIGAGLAFALQAPISCVAGYITILRSKTFNVGDRITMGGVRGDVIALSFIQTTIMEMGEPPAVQSAAPAMWVRSWQYTGRIVTVSNSKIFAEPVYNFTREFPYIWSEMQIPISYKDNRAAAEKILLDVARRLTVKVSELAEPALAELERRYFVKREDLEPRVYWRLTDNWIEMSLRFLCEEHGVRGLSDRMSREIITGLDQAGVGIASGTYEVVGMPPLRVQLDAGASAQQGNSHA
jgi:small-conductance mechanosensitive channel